MKLVAVSDTHGDKAILEAILAQQADADLFLYAGDSELPADDSMFARYQAVRGNMDFDSAFPLTRTLQLGDLTVFLTHGHRFGVNWTMDQLLAAGQAVHAGLIIFGHTHQLGGEKHEGVVLLNPGSISQPRGEFMPLGGTYAVVETTPTQLKLAYHLRDGQPVAKLTRVFER
ncbi:metallophosphoesterase [Lacticaseibacillus mingshuiensis]|uniref:Phosphoesterase n=1 Tax=Lacticaseibacillus mingshuiensis TaxID=2799574 RepID=A0ABW4CG68_9LACO|nr:metallophosphoesterase [Lacticaseibacillus mingshuiensis]